ncbi:hypothetical protein [Streptomyces sp. NBC_01518]|uniref:hypothetical protein n=1 Tax=Streptomyces sp. NBC_01518 TaxID=2903891 RepID=UPI0038630470
MRINNMASQQGLGTDGVFETAVTRDCRLSIELALAAEEKYRTCVRERSVTGSHSLWASYNYRTRWLSSFRRDVVFTYTPLGDNGLQRFLATHREPAQPWNADRLSFAITTGCLCIGV